MIVDKNQNLLKLTIELVPSTVWYSSLYQYYKKSNNMQKWNEIKKELFAKEENKCWICGKETRHLEAHEFWRYDDTKHIQKLDAIHHLCGLCHKVKHIGLWLHTDDGAIRLKNERLRTEDIIDHFCILNKCSQEEFQKYEDEAFKIWNQRNRHKWKQDFGRYDQIINAKMQNNLSLKQFI